MNYLTSALTANYVELALFAVGLIPYIFLSRKLIINKLNQTLKASPNYNALEKYGVSKRLFYWIVNFYFLIWNSIMGGALPACSKFALAKNIILTSTTVVSTMMLVNALSGASQKFVPRAHSNLLLGIQAIKALSYLTIVAFATHYLFGTSISSLVASVGITTGVVILLFKDTILGMIASLQAVLTDSLRIGDHVYLKQYEIDGVMEYISPFMIRIRHWDGSSSTLHSYALVSGSMKNFRDRHTARKRKARIKIPISTSSIRMAEPKLIDEVKLLTKPLLPKVIESPAPGATNLEMFKSFVKAYLQHVPAVKGAAVHYMDGSDGSIILDVFFSTAHMDIKSYESLRSQLIEHVFAVANQMGLSK